MTSENKNFDSATEGKKHTPSAAPRTTSSSAVPATVPSPLSQIVAPVEACDGLDPELQAALQEMFLSHAFPFAAMQRRLCPVPGCSNPSAIGKYRRIHQSGRYEYHAIVAHAAAPPLDDTNIHCRNPSGTLLLLQYRKAISKGKGKVCKHNYDDSYIRKGRQPTLIFRVSGRAILFVGKHSFLDTLYSSVGGAEL